MSTPLYPLNPLEAICNILQAEMALDTDQVYFYQSKIQPITDERLYIAVGLGAMRPFSNISKMVAVSGGFTEELTTNVWAEISIDMLSKSEIALNAKESVILALGSNYSKQVQESQSMMIARLPANFVNLSDLEGASIPYRFQISVSVQYKVTKTKPIPYYETFPLDVVKTNQ